MTMFKKSGRGFKKPFCINEKCAKFLPEDQRGYPKKKTETADAPTEETKETKKKAVTKKDAATKTTAKKTTTKKTTTAKKKTAKATEED